MLRGGGMGNQKPDALLVCWQGTPPAMATVRLRLLPLDEKYAEDAMSYGNDEEFLRFVDAERFDTIDHAKEFLGRLQSESETGSRKYWSVIDKSLSQMIGTVGLIPVSIQHRVAELGFGIARSHWGTGVFLEAARAVIEYGFDVMKVERLQMQCRAANVRAISGCAKIGFKKEALLSGYYDTGSGLREDACLMSLLRSEFTVPQSVSSRWA